MLQQTQVSRVLIKFPSFIKKFPDWKSLARASTKEILQEWSGLGYNRRALYLRRIAEEVMKMNGRFPKTFEELRKLPGIGPNTAGSILAFAYNIPSPFIETNIRSVYIHFFFPEIEKSEGKKACKKISDDQLFPLIEKTLDTENPREWYYALMDYGADLKKRLPNPSRHSAHHIKQKPFKGSNRELRSKILKEIMKKSRTRSSLMAILKAYEPAAIEKNIDDLCKEGFLGRNGNKYAIMSA